MPSLKFDYSLCQDKLWNFHKDSISNVNKREEIETGIQMLSQRIYCSMKCQTRIARINKFDQKPEKLYFTQLKGRAEVLQYDAIGFLGYFSKITEYLKNTNLHNLIDILTVSKIYMVNFEHSTVNSYGGEMLIEFTAHTEYELLFDSCYATSMVIAYAMNTAQDAGHLMGSLDVLEYYNRDVFGHPLLP